MSRRGVPTRLGARAFGCGVLVALAASAVARTSHASDADSTLGAAGGMRAQVTLRPNIAKVGEVVIYRARILDNVRVTWLPPEPDSNLTWGPLTQGIALGRAAERRYGAAAAKPAGPSNSVNGLAPDTSWAQVSLQVFQPGILPIPGLRFTLAGNARPGYARVPMVSLIVVNTLTAADSAKGLKDVHGPVPAPWWERVPWAWVMGGLLTIGLVILLVRLVRRRKPVPAMAPVVVRRDPMAEALAELKALRAMHLPEEGRFGEHAFRLGQILRRYLEATVHLAMPGDTTPELVAHLRNAGLPNEDLQRMTALLRLWDRVKFAREPLTVEEATRTETAVESYVRARPPGPATPQAGATTGPPEQVA